VIRIVSKPEKDIFGYILNHFFVSKITIYIFPEFLI